MAFSGPISVSGLRRKEIAVGVGNNVEIATPITIIGGSALDFDNVSGTYDVAGDIVLNDAPGGVVIRGNITSTSLNNPNTPVTVNANGGGTIDLGEVSIAGTASEETPEIIPGDDAGSKELAAIAVVAPEPLFIDGGNIGGTNVNGGSVFIVDTTATGTLALNNVTVVAETNDLQFAAVEPDPIATGEPFTFDLHPAIENNAGTITTTGGSFTNRGAGPALEITGNSGTVNIGSTIVNTADVPSVFGTALDIDTITDGTVTITGDVTRNGEGAVVVIGDLFFPDGALTGGTVNINGAFTGSNGATIDIDKIGAAATVNFTFGDGEGDTDKGSTIDADVAISANPGPAGDTCNFEDVLFDDAAEFEFPAGADGAVIFVATAATW